MESDYISYDEDLLDQPVHSIQHTGSFHPISSQNVWNMIPYEILYGPKNGEVTHFVIGLAP